MAEIKWWYTFPVDNLYDVAILGGGPAGLTAGIYTSRALLSSVIFAGDPPGGQLTTAAEVENFPGFPEGILGSELIQKITEQAQKFGSKIINANITSVSGTFQEKFTLTLESKETFIARSLIIATGASAKWLGLKTEQEFRGKGVSACATCDGFFFKGKEVAVVGAGDAALQEAEFLTRFANKVHILVRKPQDEMRASKISQERVLANPKIELHCCAELLEVLGNPAGDRILGIKLINNKTQEVFVLPQVEGVFIAIGHAPNTKFLQGFVDLDDQGYVVSHDLTKTSQEGVFVAGDVSDARYKQAITAAGLGCMAALDLEKFLSSQIPS